MTPIESQYDTRLITLIGLAINVIESLAIAKNVNPEEILASHLYLANKYVHEVGEEVYLHKLTKDYPLLEEAIR